MKFPSVLPKLALFALALFASLQGVSAEAPSRQIDSFIEAGYKKENITPNPIASEGVFVRRIYLDIIGRIPTKKETLDFTESNDSKKKSALIDQLLDSDGYVSHHYNYWADILRARSQINGTGQGLPAGFAYTRWIKDSLRENKPYDEFVSEMVSASGSSWENGAVGYYLRDYGMPLDNMAITSQVFLGTEIVCAQCHNHPFDKWTQMDYYHLAAFTYGKLTTNQTQNARQAISMAAGKAKSKQAAKAATEDLRRAASEILKPVRFNNVVDTPRNLKLPHDYQYDDAKPKSTVRPSPLFSPDAALSDATDPSEAFAEWITSEKNERFTKVIANRLWKKAFGVGIIEPVDNITDHTTPSNPELLAFLEEQMRGFDYDMKKFLRMIYNTKTYQRESSLAEPELGMAYHFPGPVLRRMSAEQIWDSMIAMTVPDPDHPSRELKLSEERRLLEVKMIAESLYDQTPAEFLRNAREVAQIQRVLADAIDTARAELTEARASKDPVRIRAAIADAARLRRQLEKEIETKVYKEGLEKKVELAANDTRSQKKSDVFLADLADAKSGNGKSSGGEMMMTMGGTSNGYIRQLVDGMMLDEYAVLKKEKNQKEVEEMKQWGIETKVDKSIYKKFGSIRKNLVRASELRSPSPEGHFLRSFGQSDRELVENSNDQASVTQALAMLNGPVIGGITSRYSVLSRDMQGERLKDRLDTIFLTMLSRHPRPDEQAIFEEAWEADPESGSVQGIVWTVLNMRQFLFVE